MRVDADVRVALDAEIYDTVEDTMHLRQAANAVDDVVRLGILEPCSVEDLGIGGLGRWQTGEIGHDDAVVLNDETALALDVGFYSSQRRVVASPLIEVAVGPHDGLRLLEDVHDSCSIGRQCRWANDAVAHGIME